MSTAMARAKESDVRRLIASVPNWYHRIEVAPGIWTPGVNDTPVVLQALGLPDTMSGLRVLDIGARDGFFSFECERRGADVVAIDYAPPGSTGFPLVKELIGSKLNLIQENLFNVTPEKYGLFDIVLFLGVLYHLRDPMMGIDIVRSVCKGELFLETHVMDSEVQMPNRDAKPLASIHPDLAGIPLMQFYPRNALNNDYTNYWGPNMRCVELMLEEANFRVLSSRLHGHRGIFRCTIGSDDQLEYLNRISRGLI